ncbi:MAG: dihydroneopterin aldolase family protein [Thermoplasmata archaeon]
MTASKTHRASLTDREALLFEAGIKLGGIFHQYLGIPVSSTTARGLAETIERAVGLQPYVTRVEVRIDPARGPRPGRGRFAYRYLTPEMLDVRIQLRDGASHVEARLVHQPELRYPLMSVDRTSPRSAHGGDRPTSGRRSARRAGRRGRRTSPSAG